MPPARYIRGSIHSIPVPDGNFDNLQAQPGGAEQQIKITEGIELAKM
jgi:hypothetical protein